jgi:cyclophilin family peptidyl-prolyl cis-trans isomerase
VRRFLWLLFAPALMLLTGCSSNDPVVEVDTSLGNFKIELLQYDAPITVKNFLQYVDAKHYDNTIIHRVVKDFVVQAGGITEEGKEKLTRDPIKNESYNGLSNKRGTVAMARTEKSDSAKSHFFINVADNSSKLDREGQMSKEGYCVFGKVIEGMNVVDAINAVKTGPGDIPVDNVIIKSIRRVESN